MSPQGITTLADIMERCHVSDSGCWHWRYACNSWGTPQAWYPTRGITTSVSSIAHSISKGCLAPSGKVWRPFCGEGHCVNPDHQRYVSRSQINAGKKSPVHVMKMTRASRGRSKLSPADVAEIRVSVGTLKETAAVYGVTRSTISRIRRGDAWATIAPASVFSLGG